VERKVIIVNFANETSKQKSSIKMGLLVVK